MQVHHRVWFENSEQPCRASVDPSAEKSQKLFMVSTQTATVSSAESLLPKGAKITPMLRQWLDAKAKARDAVLLFRMGDFYELFGEDAERAAPLLDLVVTSRDRDKGEDSLAMAGFPHHAAPQYIARLVQAGLKVAVCEQMEDPAMARGIVKRDVTRVVTPGMVLDDESLDASAHNFLVAILPPSHPRRRAAPIGVAALDLSTGTFFASTVADERSLIDEVVRFSPRELVVPETLELSSELRGRLDEFCAGEIPMRIEPRPLPKPGDDLLSTLGSLDRFFLDAEQKNARLAAELCLGYVMEAQGALPTHLRSPQPYAIEEHLLLDATTRRHLDLVGPPGDLRKAGSLAALVDVTQSAPGGRKLLHWLLTPSTDMSTIEGRLDRVAAFVEDPGLRHTVRDGLRGFYDIERLTARVAASRAGPRELGRLRDSLTRIPALISALLECDSVSLQELALDFDLMDDVASRLDEALLGELPLALGQGSVFRAEFDGELDSLTSFASGGKDAIAGMEERERAATGIPSLKVKYTRVFGYYLEVTKTHLSKVPDHYRRKQTVANAERFVTEELSQLEAQVASAETKRTEREAMLFETLRQEIATHANRFLMLAEKVAEIDALAAFAEVSDDKRYVRPLLLPKNDKRTCVQGGRHPIVESSLTRTGDTFIPSDIELTGDDRQLILVTGPNMAGKSTLMRQVALVQILAQAGCFVPAKKAELSICDRIFTRVGANDDLAQGRSTFMVEMNETAHILEHATEHSLVLLDEIGRGTSTFDGLSIAWSVAEHIHDNVGARTLFATHYHELCDLAESLDRVKNVHVVVKEWNDEIIFTRTLAEGGAERSYGIQVARLAGLPKGVIARAREVLSHLEGTPEPVSPMAETRPRPRIRAKKNRPQMDLFGAASSVIDEESSLAGEAGHAGVALDEAHLELLKRLGGLDVHRLTPLQSMNELASFIDAARQLTLK